MGLLKNTINCDLTFSNPRCRTDAAALRQYHIKARLFGFCNIREMDWVLIPAFPVQLSQILLSDGIEPGLAPRVRRLPHLFLAGNQFIVGMRRSVRQESIFRRNSRRAKFDKESFSSVEVQRGSGRGGRLGRRRRFGDDGVNGGAALGRLFNVSVFF